jgi:3-oxoacyl-[acyl-carrier protein] reductase
MLLKDKIAVVYGAGGAVGSAVARAYAREGAYVHLIGRSHTSLDETAQRIGADGGSAEVTTLDVLDQDAVEHHAASVAASNGIDICFNATANDDLQGTLLLDLDFADFLRPVIKSVTAHHHIATATGRQMTRRGSGVILVMAGGREAIPRLGGAHVAWTALVGLCRQLAAEFGPHGIRVNWLLSPGSTPAENVVSEDTAPEAEALLPRHRPSYEEVANIATFAASDWARTMTASELNFTGGVVID